MSAPAALDRRSFLKTGAAAGGGLVIAFYVPALSAQEQKPKPEPIAPFAYIKIASDEKVTIVANHSEMGQGVYTSLPMLLNEELDADWSKIRVEAAPVDAIYSHPIFGIQMTGGSTTTAAEWHHYRKLGAAGRMVLVEAAAQKWKVPASSCHVEKGFVIHAATSKKASYGSLVDAASKLSVPADIPLKEPKNFTLIGKPTRRLDTPPKTNGTAQFGLDIIIPGMMTAMIARCPVFGGKVLGFDATEAQHVPGVKAVLEVPTALP